MSFYWSNSWGGQYDKYYNESTMDLFIDTYKCTVFRLAYDRDNGSNNGWDGCQRLINHAIKRGVYVIIDWHSHTAFRQENEAVAFFKTQAQNYKNTPNVIFEPFNEPITLDGNRDDGSLATAVVTWKGIKPYLTNVTKAIRGEGADNLVILGTPYFSQYVNVAARDQVKDDNGNIFKNVAYSFHFYAASHGADAIYAIRTAKGGLEGDFLAGALGQIPLFVTEWGTTHSDGGQDASHWEVDETNTDWWFNRYVNGQYHLSSCNWSVSDFQASSFFSGGSPNLSTSGKVVKRLLTAQTTDTFLMPSDTGYLGPAKDTVFSMPGTHPAVRFNRYYGAGAKADAIKWSERDTADGRTAKDKYLTVSAQVDDDYVAYNINCASATKNIIVRCLAKGGSGTIDVLLDAVKIGTITIPKSSEWVSVLSAANVSAGKHTLKFNFTSATYLGFGIEWFELTNGTSAITVSSQRKITAGDIKMSAVKNGFAVTMPASHRYTSYKLLGVDGRIVKSVTLNSNISQLTVNDLPDGMWLLKFDGLDGAKFFKTVVGGR
jgi:endoglucanase